MPCPSKSTAMVSRDVPSVRGFHGEVHGRADGSVDAAYAPGPRRIDVGDFGGDGAAGAADPPGGQAPRAGLGRAGMVQVAFSDAGLPFAAPGRIGGVGNTSAAARSTSAVAMTGGRSAV